MLSLSLWIVASHLQSLHRPLSLSLWAEAASEVTKQGVHGVPSDFWELSGGCQVAQSHLALVVSFSYSCARQSWIPAGFVFAEGTQV